MGIKAFTRCDFAVFFLFLLFYYSCSDQGALLRNSKRQSLAQLVVSPFEVDFGIFDATTLFDEIIIENLGNGRLQVDRLSIVSDSRNLFFSPSPPQSFVATRWRKSDNCGVVLSEEAYSNIFHGCGNKVMMLKQVWSVLVLFLPLC